MTVPKFFSGDQIVQKLSGGDHNDKTWIISQINNIPAAISKKLILVKKINKSARKVHSYWIKYGNSGKAVY